MVSSGEWFDVSPDTTFSYIAEYGGTQTLHIDAGVGHIIFADAVGSAGKDFGSLTVNGAGLAVNGREVLTTGDQTYNVPITLGADTTFEGNDIVFNNTVDSDATVRSMTVNTLTNSGSDHGSLNINATIGATNPLASLNPNNEGQLFLSSVLMVSDGGLALGDIVLTDDSELNTGSGAGDITLNGTVTAQGSARDLTLNAGR